MSGTGIERERPAPRRRWWVAPLATLIGSAIAAVLLPVTWAIDAAVVWGVWAAFAWARVVPGPHAVAVVGVVLARAWWLTGVATNEPEAEARNLGPMTRLWVHLARCAVIVAVAWAAAWGCR